MANEPGMPPPSGLERKLVTILSADVAEYSRLMAEDEEQTLRIFREYSRTFSALVELHHGRIFNTAGDAILAEFTSPVEAVRCATDIQAALRTRNDQFPPARQVRFRIGVNLGDVMTQNSDLMGDGVNVAARLQSAAEPGGICVSGSVYDQIRNKLSLSFESLGERRFKNIPQPVRTFTITGTDDHGALPAAKNSSGRTGALAKYTAAAVLLVALSGGYLAYSEHQGSPTEHSLAKPQPGAHPAAAAGQASQQANIRPSTQMAAPVAAQPSPATDQPRVAPATQPAANAAAQPEPVRHKTAAVQIPQQASEQSEQASTSATAGSDGVYVGPVCYGEGPRNPARCFRGRATIAHGEISGQWQIGPAESTMLLSGTVDPAGDVRMEMHPQDAEGRRRGMASLSGTLHDGRLDATGEFLNGRTVSFKWHRS